MMRIQPSDREAIRSIILERTIRIPEAGCWIWADSCMATGYGQFRFKNKHYYVHQASYEIFVTEPSDGMFICHRCDIRPCANPYHLFEGTQTDNMHDASMKRRVVGGNGILGAAHYCAKLTPDAILDIRTRRVSQRAFAILYGVSPGAISHVQSGRSWKSV